jgi:uncharacterized damage-inducible protein DinB
MSFGVEDLVDGLRKSRAFFFKHLIGLAGGQWDWKPYPECKSIRDTLAHLIVDDRMAMESLSTGKEPDYEKAVAEETTPEKLADIADLRKRVETSHQTLCNYLLEQFGTAAMDSDICVWGGTLKVGRGIPYFSSEDYYHAGQVAFIRMATDPS